MHLLVDDSVRLKDSVRHISVCGCVCLGAFVCVSHVSSES